MGHLPSIDLLRVQDGNASLVMIEKGFKDGESDRSLGFRNLLAKFVHKVNMRSQSVSDLFIPLVAAQHGICNQLAGRRSRTCPLGTLAIFQLHSARPSQYALIPLLVYPFLK